MTRARSSCRLTSAFRGGLLGTFSAALLFREGRVRRFRLDTAVVGSYLTVVLLHGLWDGLPTSLELVLPLGTGLPIGQTLVAAAGLLLLWRRWREAVRLQRAADRPSSAPLTVAPRWRAGSTPGGCGSASSRSGPR